ncbi:Cof-type HAD-IIB family hydrolase [Thaumasiovibrio subtropicus]|uniref:Cof-type HAD-IIB family hydrolase n=1 Tax=Thaumasiovibrio subtropicus TaxID=1891207 RepID=UPI000B3569D5|nr:Cof-type HAD-IIB family hydrolase [Thaumasiovibrio subtropicus]
MYKVLALDLDGTVLSDDHTIHPEVKRAIVEAQRRCHVVIVTGRHHTAARPYYHELGLSTPIICCNGTYVYDYQNEQVITHNAIKKQDALNFIALAKEFQVKMVMYITDAMTYSHFNPIHYMEALEKWAHANPGEQQPKIYKVNSFSDTASQAEHVWKFVVEGLPSSVERLQQHPWVKATFNGERSWSNRIDFAAKGNSKGQRLAEYVAELGYHANHVMAVGDNHNDISMLKYAGLGVAMPNADDWVKSHARLVSTTDNNSDGLAHLIQNKIQG